MTGLLQEKFVDQEGKKLVMSEADVSFVGEELADRGIPLEWVDQVKIQSYDNGEHVLAVVEARNPELPSHYNEIGAVFRMVAKEWRHGIQAT